MADLVTLEQLKDHLGIPDDDTESDSRLSQAIAGASVAVRNFTGRDFGDASATATRTYRYDGRGWLNIDEASAVTSVTYDGLALVVDIDYVVGPDRGPVYDYLELFRGFSSPEMGFERNLDTLAIYGRRYRYVPVAVTATFGWPAIPEDVQLATLMTAVNLVENPRLLASAQIERYGITAEARNLTQAIPPAGKELLWQYKKVNL
jgi:hypothetical protein